MTIITFNCKHLCEGERGGCSKKKTEKHNSIREMRSEISLTVKKQKLKSR